MTNKRTTTNKSKNKSGKFKRLSKFNPLHLLLLISVFSVIGATLLYNSNAATIPGWGRFAANHDCKLRGYGFPPTLSEGYIGNCSYMLKDLIVKRAPKPIRKYIGAVDKNFGPGTTTAVKLIKSDFKLYNSAGKVDGVVDPATWVVMRHIWLNGYYPKAYQPPPPPNTGLGVDQQPPPSGKLTGADKDNFNTLYNSLSSVGWCIIKHESVHQGMYQAIQSNGIGPATGAFQFEGGFGTIKNSNTWQTIMAAHPDWPRAYKWAALAPADVQWTAFFWLYDRNPGAWSGTHCPGT